MQARFPLEIFLLIVENVEADDKPLLRSLILVSRAFYLITRPRLYEIATFSHGHTLDTRLLQNFYQAVTKNNGKLGHHVRILSLHCYFTYFSVKSQFLDWISTILPLLTCMAHFQLDHPGFWNWYARQPVLSAFNSSQLTTFIWTPPLFEDEEDIIEFLAAHPSIEHLELPNFRFTDYPPLDILPQLRKLLLRDDDFLSYNLLQNVSHLSLVSVGEETIINDDAEFEETYSAIEHFSALDDFNPETVAKFCSQLLNLRSLSLITFPGLWSLMSTYPKVFRDSEFRSKRLQYLLLCSQDNDPKSVQEIFNVLPTVYTIDVIDSASEDEVFTRYSFDQTPISLPLDLLPSRWITEEDMEQILA